MSNLFYLVDFPSEVIIFQEFSVTAQDTQEFFVTAQDVQQFFVTVE